MYNDIFLDLCQPELTLYYDEIAKVWCRIKADGVRFRARCHFLSQVYHLSQEETLSKMSLSKLVMKVS